MKFMSANSIAPDEMLHSLASNLGQHFLPMSHKWDERLIVWVIKEENAKLQYQMRGGCALIRMFTVIIGPFSTQEKPLQQ